MHFLYICHRNMIQSNFIFYKCALKAGTQIKKGIGEVGDVGDQFRGDIFNFKDCPSVTGRYLATQVGN